MTFRFTPRAESEVDREQAWWREHRPKAPDLFDEELEQAIEQIVRRPRREPSTRVAFPRSSVGFS